MLDKIAIIGYSGHGIVVADAALKAGMPLTDYCESKVLGSNPMNLNYLGFEQSVDFVGWSQNYSYILGIGDCSIRNKIALNILSHNKNILNVIHPDTFISKYFNLGTGNFIASSVSINALVSIGDFCILNTGCIIEHECKIGNAVHIAPGAVLSGNVEVGDLSFVGANAVVKQGVKIGSNVIVGAGSVILKDIADNLTIVGNPGRKI